MSLRTMVVSGQKNQAQMALSKRRVLRVKGAKTVPGRPRGRKCLSGPVLGEKCQKSIASCKVPRKVLIPR